MPRGMLGAIHLFGGNVSWRFSKQQKSRLPWGTIVYTMSPVRFEWDPRKAEANSRVHRISFAEAVTVLGDTFALTREDSTAIGEQRYASLGLSDRANLLVVVYTYREPNNIRIISAWKANKRQRKLYEEARS